MVNPINETGSVTMSPEVMNKSPNNSTVQPEGTVRPELTAQAVSGADKSYGSPGVKKTAGDVSDYPITDEPKGEVRKNDMTDGKVTIKVYDYSGKLLRKIPPGYLPLGEQNFDVTV